MMRLRSISSVALTALATTALAFSTINYGSEPARWRDAHCTVTYDPQWAGFPSFPSELRSSLQPWSHVEGSNFTFTSAGPSPSTNLRSNTNGNNDAYFDDLSPSVYAITWVYEQGPIVYDRDVVFNTDWNWTTGTGGGVDFRTVSIHEYGHVLGLDHESNKPAVMQPYYDGYSLIHSLRFDDAEGCRFIYPEPVPEPAPPTDADLQITDVRFTPSDAQAGEEIRITFEMKNVGTDPTGLFAATALISPDAAVTPDDRYLRATAQSGLQPGESRRATIASLLPDVLEPRTYHVGVILDAQEATGDRNRSNNTGVAVNVIEGGGDALLIGPGYRVEGRLLPLGRESFSMDLTAGARVSANASIDDGTVVMRLYERDSGEIIFQKQRYRRASGKFKVPRDGVYVVQLDNHSAAAADYELRIGAKTIKHTGTLTVTNANQVHLPGYRASMVDVRLKAKGDVRPTLEWVDVESTLKRNKKGNKVKLTPAMLLNTGPLVLALSRGEGPAGDVSYRIRVRVPKKGPLVRQVYEDR